MKNFNFFWIHWKIQFLEGGSRKTNIEEGLPKKGVWRVCKFKAGVGGGGGGVGKKGGGRDWGGGGGGGGGGRAW